MKELLDFFRECSSTDDDFVCSAAEGVVDLLVNALLDLSGYHRHRQQQFDAIVLDLREHLFADDLLDDQGDGDNQGGLHVGKSLSNDGRRRQTRQEEKVAAIAESEKELYGHTIHVSHRQDTQQIITGFHVLANMADNEFNVTPDGAIG